MKLRTPILHFACLMYLAVLIAPVHAGETRLQDFIRNFDEMDLEQTARAEWLGPKSPFAPYLKHSVVEALGESERALYGKAFNAGACRMVRMLGTIGFLNRYSHLALAFERSNVRAIFGVYILPILTPDQERCTPNHRGQNHLPFRPEMPARPNPHG